MAADDDSVANPTDSTQLLNTFWMNIAVFSILLLLFESVRHIKLVYMPRLKSKALKRRSPPQPSKFAFAWILSIFDVEEETVLKTVGLDAYMMLRFITVCFRICAFFTFFGLVILIPVYESADAGLAHWAKYTMANIKDDYKAERLWTPVIFAYFFAMFYCQMLHNEYGNFVKRRIAFLSEEHQDIAAQTYYTVMIEKIPNTLRSGPVLKEFFDSVFPGEVFTVELILKLKDLDRLNDRRKAVCVNLERSLASLENEKQRPTLFVKKTDILSDQLDESHASTTTCMTSIYNCFGYIVTDAIDYHTDELKTLNKAFEDLKKYNLTKQQQQFSEDSGRLARVKDVISIKGTLMVSQISEKLSALSPIPAGTFETRSDEDEEDPPTDKDKGNNDMDRDMDKEYLDSEKIITDNDTEAQISTASSSGDPDEENNRGNQLSDEFDDTIAEEPLSEKFFRVVSRQTRNLSKFLKDTTDSLLKATVREGIVTASATGEGAAKVITEASDALKLLLVGSEYMVSSTAFVTFKTRVSCSQCTQMFLSHDYHDLQVTAAPSPMDIVWNNVSVQQQQIDLRKTIADAGVILGAIFWSVFVAAITAFSSLDSISKSIPSLQKYSDTKAYDFINTYLALGVLLIVLAILPFFFDIISRQYEGIKFESQIQNIIMSRYFYYLLANVSVAITLGSVSYSLNDIIKNPKSIMSILGSSVPSFSVYFSQFVIIKAFTAVPIEMLRIPQLLAVVGLFSVTKRETVQRRELTKGLFADPPMLYGWVYPNLLMVLMIAVCYNCIAPFVLPFCCVYYALVYMMYKYQLLYVYINPEQGGGFMWYAVFDYAMTALMFGIFVLICYLAIRKTFFSGPFYCLVPLPFIIGTFWARVNQKFKVQALNLSLERAVKIDEAHAIEAEKGQKVPVDDFRHNYYCQPSLTEGELEPTTAIHYGVEDGMKASISKSQSSSKSPSTSKRNSKSKLELKIDLLPVVNSDGEAPSPGPLSP